MLFLLLLLLLPQTRMHKLLMQSLPCGYHRKHMLVPLNQTLHQHGFRSVILQKLFHLFAEFAGIAASDCVDTHRLCKTDKIGICHSGVGIAGVVKEI